MGVHAMFKLMVDRANGQNLLRELEDRFDFSEVDMTLRKCERPERFVLATKIKAARTITV